MVKCVPSHYICEQFSVLWQLLHVMHDSDWRISHVCDVSGSIFSFSSHGSMLTAALIVMAITRAYNIACTFTELEL